MVRKRMKSSSLAQSEHAFSKLHPYTYKTIENSKKEEKEVDNKSYESGTNFYTNDF